MEVYVARQPIFDAAHKVFGYELLFRGGIEGALASAGSGHVSLSSILDAGAITGGRRAFIRFPGDLIERGAPATVPGDALGIQIPGDANHWQVCEASAEAIALDGFTRGSGQKPGELADIIKISFCASRRSACGTRGDLGHAAFWASEVTRRVSRSRTGLLMRRGFLHSTCRREVVAASYVADG